MLNQHFWFKRLTPMNSNGSRNGFGVILFIQLLNFFKKSKEATPKECEWHSTGSLRTIVNSNKQREKMDFVPFSVFSLSPGHPWIERIFQHSFCRTSKPTIKRSSKRTTKRTTKEHRSTQIWAQRPESRSIGSNLESTGSIWLADKLHEPHMAYLAHRTASILNFRVQSRLGVRRWFAGCTSCPSSGSNWKL